MTTDTRSEPTTKPRTVPLEPTTPIRPSEAIRLGCLLAPVQSTGSFFGDGGKACALGAMALGLGYDGPRLPVDEMPDLADPYPFVEQALPGFLPDPKHDHQPRDAASVIYRLNDNGWSRERIADWLAGLGL